MEVNMELEECSPFFYRCRIKASAQKEHGEESGYGVETGRSSREIQRREYALGNKEMSADGVDDADSGSAGTGC